jgi:hypothetical protein
LAWCRGIGGIYNHFTEENQDGDFNHFHRMTYQIQIPLQTNKRSENNGRLKEAQ